MARATSPPKARLGFPTGRLRNALTASGERATGEKAGRYRSLIQPWQQDAFRFYNTVGECWFATQFYSRLSKLRLFAGYRDEQGEIEEADPSDPLSEIFSRVQDPGGGGYSDLLASYGRLMFLTGEGYMTVTNVGGEEQWEFLSCNELRAVPGGGGYVRLKAPSLPQEQLANAPDDEFSPLGEGTATVYRFWKRSPEFSYMADSPMRGVLDLFQELLLLTLAVKARATSRAAGPGLLYVAEELSFGTPTGLNTEDPEMDPFQARLQQIMVATVRDPGAASSVVPAVIRGPAKIGDVSARDAIFSIQLHDPMQTYPEEGLREELIRRIATGVDMPAEELLGKGESNHWSGWIIDDDAWASHLEPRAQEFVNNLAACFLRPAAKQAGITNWQDVVIGYDPAAIINHPDQSKDAKDVWDRGGIGYAALRAATNFEDGDAQTDEEHQEYLARILKDPLSLPAGEGESSGAVDGASDSTGLRQQSSATANEGIPAESTAAGEGTDESSLAASGKMFALLTLMGAAELANLRTRELAGARLLRFARGECPECVRGLKVPKSMVASAIGQDLALKSEGGINALVKGGADGFAELCHMQFGLNAEIAERLGELIERHAGEHLFTEHQQLPPGFRGYAQRLLTVEDGRQSVHATAA